MKACIKNTHPLHQASRKGGILANISEKAGICAGTVVGCCDGFMIGQCKYMDGGRITTRKVIVSCRLLFFALLKFLLLELSSPIFEKLQNKNSK